MPRVPIDSEYNHRLLVSFFELLSKNKQGDGYEFIRRILVETGRHFEFGCGFVYEVDHTGTFFLNESFTDYEVSLDEPFRLEERFGNEEIQQFFAEPFFIRNRAKEVAGQVGDRQLFASNTYVMAPVLDTDEQLIALVGLADRRVHLHWSEDTLMAAKMVLGLVAT